jgi:haloacetate dehalogenase
VFDGFVRERIETAGAEINVVHAGSGPPVLLLHGGGQSLALWHSIGPALAERHTVVAADLRGYREQLQAARRR